jgi:hypothetical protein
VGNFYEDVLAGEWGIERCADPARLEPVTRAAVASIIAAAKAELGIDLMIFETYRSQARQEQLFAKHATELRTVGVHGYGLACDLVKSIGGQPSWAGDFEFLGPLARRFGLVWGGDWGKPANPHGFHDLDHVQRCSVADQAKLFEGTWYPDAAYAPFEAAA